MGLCQGNQGNCNFWVVQQKHVTPEIEIYTSSESKYVSIDVWFVRSIFGRDTTEIWNIEKINFKVFIYLQ